MRNKSSNTIAYLSTICTLRRNFQILGDEPFFSPVLPLDQKRNEKIFLRLCLPPLNLLIAFL